jgi:transposase
MDLYVGLDVHRDTITATALDSQGSVVDTTRLSSRDEDLVQYLQKLPGRKHVALEACCVWQHVYDAARTQAEDVVLAHPYKTRLIAEASLTSDKVDAKALAELRRLNGLPKAYAPDDDTRKLRQLVRDHHYYVELQSSIKCHTYAVLLRKGIPYQPGVMNLKRKREELHKLGLPEVDRGLDALKDLEALCKDLDKQIHEAFLASKEAQLLYSIPGIGEYTALALVAELCPIQRFPNGEKLASYAGLVCTNHQSGSVSYHGSLKKDSNHFLTTLFVEAGWRHRYLEKKGDVAKKARRVARRRGKGKGSIAGAHKLALIVYAVLKRGTPYTPERPAAKTALRGP